MKVEQIMTPSPATCGPLDNLAQAAEHMWDADCGLVPVVDDNGRPVGVITDRDICIAAATRDLAPAQIQATEMVRGHVYCCRPDDTVKTALKLMTLNRVRRLLVTTESGILHGIVSLDDVARIAGRRGGVAASDVVATLAAVSAPPTATSSSSA